MEKVTTDMQSAVDVAWNSGNTKIRSLFPNGKPTLEEFSITIKGEISKNVTY